MRPRIRNDVPAPHARCNRGKPWGERVEARNWGGKSTKGVPIYLPFPNRHVNWTGLLERRPRYMGLGSGFFERRSCCFGRTLLKGDRAVWVDLWQEFVDLCVRARSGMREKQKKGNPWAQKKK